MKQSYGILLYRWKAGQPEFFLVHPGGPFFVNKHAGTWTIPKGEANAGEAPLHTAIREFEEETGYRPSGHFIPLAPIVQKGGKQVHCWAVEGDLDAGSIRSNTFELEWPPHSAKKQTFREVDHAEWYNFEEASKMINEKQQDLLVQFSNLAKNNI
ncbi:NUDIX domain-containing protein [Pedobacter heparinus]|uniref:NUDIX domain-containing protein n=1 Tax=Pedobacter heparinus TaxID=984 RepID=UPI00292F3DBF|nr:NUDIX domain-containing protein [Pedobacter heparinus]